MRNIFILFADYFAIVHIGGDVRKILGWRKPCRCWIFVRIYLKKK